jgi:O-antigen ligase
MVMYLVLRTMPLTRAERWRIVDLLILTGAVVSVVGFYQGATRLDPLAAGACANPLHSVFGTPNNAALFLGRLIPITAAVVLVGGAKPRRWLYGAAGILMLAAAVLTCSEGALLLGIPAGLAMVLILWAGRPALIAVAAAAVLEGVALIPLSRLPRFRSLLDFSSGESSSFFRVQLYRSTFRMIADHPLTGLGLDQFLYQYRGRYILPSAWQQPDLSQPHNFLLNYWVRLGIVGLAAGIWIQVAFWQLSWRIQRDLRHVGTSLRALAVGLMGSMAAFIAHGMVDEVHFVIDLAFIFFMTLGLMHQMSHDLGGLQSAAAAEGAGSE